MFWIVPLMAAVGCLALMTRTPARVDALLFRLAYALFAATGVVGLTGWLGRVSVAVIDACLSFLDRWAGSLLGGGIAWVVILGLAIGWVCVMLPQRFVRTGTPLWLGVVGIWLVPLLSRVPGPLGSGIRSLMVWLGSTSAHWLSGLVS